MRSLTSILTAALVAALAVSGCGTEYLLPESVAVKLAAMNEKQREKMAVQAVRLPDGKPTFVQGEELRDARRVGGGSVRARSKQHRYATVAGVLLVLSIPMLAGGGAMVAAIPGEEAAARRDCASPNGGWLCGFGHSLNADGYRVGGPSFIALGVVGAVVGLGFFVGGAVERPELGTTEPNRTYWNEPDWRPPAPTEFVQPPPPEPAPSIKPTKPPEKAKPPEPPEYRRDRPDRF
jgi:hypothetical protein